MITSYSDRQNDTLMKSSETKDDDPYSEIAISL